MRVSLTVLILSISFAFLLGCGTTQHSRFYLLTSVASLETVATRDIEPAIGVGPIVIPKYLDRPQIVQRAGNNELKLAEAHRWAEPLGNNFTRVLAENLSLMIPTQRVAMYPWKRSTMVDYQVMIEISRFDTDMDGNVVLTANWKVLGTDEKVVAFKKSTYTEAADVAGFDTIVAAQSRTLEALSREIASAIKATAFKAEG